MSFQEELCRFGPQSGLGAKFRSTILVPFPSRFRSATRLLSLPLGADGGWRGSRDGVGPSRFRLVMLTPSRRLLVVVTTTSSCELRVEQISFVSTSSCTGRVWGCLSCLFASCLVHSFLPHHTQVEFEVASLPHILSSLFCYEYPPTQSSSPCLFPSCMAPTSYINPVVGQAL